MRNIYRGMWMSESSIKMFFVNYSQTVLHKLVKISDIAANHILAVRRWTLALVYENIIKSLIPKRKT